MSLRRIQTTGQARTAAAGMGLARGGGRPLPFGDTLHYAGCGCPPAWEPHSRAADAVDQAVLSGVDALLTSQLEPTRPLRVAYVLPHHKITGDRVGRARGCKFCPGRVSLPARSSYQRRKTCNAHGHVLWRRRGDEDAGRAPPPAQAAG